MVEHESEAGDYTESDDEGEESYCRGGYHRVQEGDLFNNGRYRVVAKLGWGHFSTVWLCEDVSVAQHAKAQGRAMAPFYVAMKVQKSAQHYTEAAYDEIELLSEAASHSNDPSWMETVLGYPCPPAWAGPRQRAMGFTGVVTLLDYFEHQGPNGCHICMVFEVMGPNVLALIKQFEFKGVPDELVRKVAAHTLVGLDYLHRVCGIIHTDLKPENVLISCPWSVPVDKLGIALIDPRQKVGEESKVAQRMRETKKEAAKPTKPAADEEKVLTKKQKRNQKRREAKKKQKEKGKKEAEKEAEKEDDNVTEDEKEMDKGKEKDAKKDAAQKEAEKGVEPAAEDKPAPVVQDAKTPDAKTPDAKTPDSKTPDAKTPDAKTPEPKTPEPRPPQDAKPPEPRQPKKYPNPPYMKPFLKPSRSDPSLLSSYNDMYSCFKPPYHGFNPQPIPVDANPNLTVPRAGPEGHFGLGRTEDLFPQPTDAEYTQLMCTGVNPFSHLTTVYKLADLGNACWLNRHFADEIQTRQYRSPEVIVGAGYGPSADMWSFACMIFELSTGDYLFDPKTTEEYVRDEDHLALTMELLGPMPQTVLARARMKRTFFNMRGELRHIKQLRFWSLESVLMQKYKFNPVRARTLSSFLLPMLHLDPEQRPTAQKMLRHPWIRGLPCDECNEFFPPPQHNFEFSPPQRELREENRGENRGEEKVLQSPAGSA
jgi:serine/threonine-protein kinase SRPK3/serine/threonine-protein kinase SRPK1